MGLFDFSNDSGSDPNAGVISPYAAQAMSLDPRRALIASMLQTNQSQLNQPTYSPLSAIAKALTGGIAGYSQAQLTKQYQDAASTLPDEISAAQKSGDPMGYLSHSNNQLAK